MRIYTSYFGNAKKLNGAGIRIICVAIGRPRYMSVPQLINVAPTRYMIGRGCSHEEYLRLYDGILSRQDANQVVKQIEFLSGGKDVALCCYEKPGDFCHRHILAKWITDNTGIKVEEFGVEESGVKEPEVIEQSLF